MTPVKPDNNNKAASHEPCGLDLSRHAGHFRTVVCHYYTQCEAGFVAGRSFASYYQPQGCARLVESGCPGVLAG